MRQKQRNIMEFRVYDSKEMQKDLDKFLESQLIKLTEEQNETK